jgi:hypothetical protein
VRNLINPPAAAPSVRALLAGAIDYAGLFPPAALAMDDAARNYASYLRSADAWALGRFVVPAARLAELKESLGRHRAGSAPWRLSVLAGPQSDDWSAAERTLDGVAAIEAIELRVRTPDDVPGAAATLPRDVEVYYEIPIEGDPMPLLGAIARAGGRAKVRTGGVTADAFPSADHLARFIFSCARAAIPFKATAGLHHPLRASYPLTYAPDSPRGEMFGFLNLLAAATFARRGDSVDTIGEVLRERDPRAFALDGKGLAWRGQHVSTAAVADTRATFALSFGSCSFTEPIGDLRALRFL